jgi:hypothetical protein
MAIPPELEGLSYQQFLTHVHPQDLAFTDATLLAVRLKHTSPLFFSTALLVLVDEVRWLQARGKGCAVAGGQATENDGHRAGCYRVETN